MVHKQRVDICSKKTHEQRSLGTKAWPIQLENIEHYGSTSSEMKTFLVKV